MALHGVTVDRISGGVRPIETLDGAPIGILASADLCAEGDLRLLRTAADVTACDGGTGTVGPIMDAIRKHSSAPVVLNVLSPANLANGTGSAATNTRAFRFLQAEAELGVRPRLFPSCLVGSVASDLIAVADRLYGQAFIDGPNSSDAAAITAAGLVSSQRAGFCDPAFVNDSDVVIGSSVLYAAVGSTLNFWESISNKPVLGVKKLSRSIGFTLGDTQCQAQLLNDAKIGTIVQKQGWRLWGGQSLSADAQFKFLCVGRTDDVIAESIKEATLWAVDAGITKTFVDDVVESVSAFLRNLKARGAIIGGSAWADKELNTPTSLAGGNLFVDYEFTPVYPAAAIRMRRHITNKYLADIFG